MVHTFAFQMNQVPQKKEPRKQDPEPRQDVAREPKFKRDPGVSEGVWQELETAKTQELVEQQKLKEEEEKARGYWLEFLPAFSHYPTPQVQSGASKHVTMLRPAVTIGPSPYPTNC